MPFVPAASTAAEGVDSVFIAILAVSVVFLLLVTFLMVYFVVKYHRKRHPRGRDIEGNAWLEIAWTLVPTVLFVAMFLYGWTNFRYMRNVPRDAMVVEVTARQWAWGFRYPNGKRTTELYVALGKPVKLELRSLDVIHGFFVPAFRIKQDVVPGKENYTWFTPNQLGSFDIECTVICGTEHANMLSKVVVVPVADFERWYFGDEDAEPPGRGTATEAAAPAVPEHPALAILRAGACLTCHSLDGSVMVGPTFLGMYGTVRTVKDSGGVARQVRADEAYLERAIRDPMSEIVQGYPPTMPVAELGEADLRRVIEFLRGLK